MSRKKKILLTIAVFVISILIVGNLYIDNIIEGTIEAELEYQIELHKNDYIIEVGKVKSTFVLKRLIIEDISIKEINAVKEDPIRKFEFRLDKLVLKLHDFSEMFSDDELWVKEIEIDEPDLVLSLDLNEFNKKSKKTGSNLFSKIRIDNINLNDGSLKLNQLDSVGAQIDIGIVDKFNLNVKSLELDLDSSKAEKKFNYEEIEFDLSGIDIDNINNHFLKAGTINYNSNEGFFSVKNIQLENSKSLGTFKQTAKNNTPWINLNVPEIKFKIPIDQLLHKNIKLDLLEIGQSSINFYQDNTLSGTSKKKLSYSEILNNFNFPLTIDTIRLLSSNANLLIKSKVINKEDTINIKNVNADILFVSNDSAYQKIHPQVEMKVQTLMWENTPAEFGVKLDVDSSSDRIQGHLRMGDLSYIKIKHILEQRIDLDLYSGVIKHFYFNFLFFENNISGDLDLLVHNVHVNPKNLILPESTKDIEFRMKELKLMAGFRRNLGESGKLIVDTLVIKKPVVTLTKVKRKNFIKPLDIQVKQGNVLFKTYQINYADMHDLTVKIYDNKGNSLPIFSIDKGWIKSRNIQVNADNNGITNFKPGSLSLELNKVSLNNSTRNFIDINQIKYHKQRGQLDITGIRYKNEASKFDFLSRKSKEKFWMELTVEKGMVDFDILKVIKGEYEISKIKIDNPIITFISDPYDTKTTKSEEKKAKQTKQTKNELLYLIDNIVLDNANIRYSIRTKQNKEHKILLANKIDCRVSNISNNPKFLNSDPELKLELNGKIFNDANINISANMDQRNGVDNGNLIFDLTNLSLKEVNNMLKPVIQKEFQKELKDGKLNALHIVLNEKNKIFDGNVSIKGLEITDLEMSSKKEKSDLLSVKINDLNLDFKKNGADANAAIIIPSMVFVKPEITIRKFTDKNKNSKNQMENKPFFAALANDANLIIDKFSIKQAKFKMFSDEETKTYAAINNTNINAKGFRVYQNKKESEIPLSIEELEIEAKDISSVNNPKMLMSLSSINYNLKQEKLTVKDFKMKTVKTLNQLYEGEKYRVPWLDIVVPSINVSFSLDDLINTNPHIRRIDVNGIKFLYKFDMKLEVNPKIKPLFVDMIKSSSIPYTVDNVTVKNSEVAIYIQHDTSLKSGYLIFNDINGTVQNISNDPGEIEKKPNTLIDINTLLWGKGQGHILGEISLSDPNKFFNLKGTVVNMDMSAADTLIKDLYNISIVKGRLNRTVFDIDFNEKESNGTVEFDYEDLKVSVLKKHHAAEMSTVQVEKKEKLNSSFVMNSIVNGLIKKNNIPDKRNYVIGSAAYVREPDKPVFRYFWFSLASGMIETIEGGLLRSVQNMKKGSEKVETEKRKNYKEQREEKKAERKEKNEAKKGV